MNKKIENTKTKLLKALCKLTTEEKLEDITVSKLCKSADVNRSTFYKYYSIPSDIIIEYTENIVRRDISSLSEDIDLYTRMLTMCRRYQQEKEIIKLFLAASGNLLMLFLDVFPYKTSHNLKSHADLYFVAGGVTALVMQWTVQDTQLSPEEMARIVTDRILLVLPDADSSKQ